MLILASATLAEVRTARRHAVWRRFENLYDSMPEYVLRILNLLDADTLTGQHKAGEMRLAFGPGDAITTINPFFNADFAYDKDSPHYKS